MNFFNFVEMLSLREQGSTDVTSWKENHQNNIFLNFTFLWTRIVQEATVGPTFNSGEDKEDN